MPRYEIEYIITPGLIGEHDGLPLTQRHEKVVDDYPDAETARRDVVAKVKKTLELFWKGSAWIYEPRLKIPPVTPPVLPQPWLDRPTKLF